MKKEWKGKRCELDQDTSVVKDIAQVIEDENIVVKDELAYVIYLTQNSQNNDPFLGEKMNHLSWPLFSLVLFT